MLHHEETNHRKPDVVFFLLFGLADVFRLPKLGSFVAPLSRIFIHSPNFGKNVQSFLQTGNWCGSLIKGNQHHAKQLIV